MGLKRFLLLFAVLSTATIGMIACASDDGLSGDRQAVEVNRAGDQMLFEGDTAPDFRLINEKEQMVQLSDHMGHHNVLLIFYPGDMTPGCTKQLCEARDNYLRLQNADTIVFGINPAGADSHQEFISEYDFPFELLVDADNDVARQYGALSPEGRIIRTVYLIDKNGEVAFAKRGMPTSAEILAYADID